MTRRAVVLFVALGVAWGIPYVLIKIAVGSLDPAAVVVGRCVVGAALLVPLAAARRQLVPALRAWRPLLVYTVVETVVPWNLLSSAERRLPSSTAGLLLAAVPLVGLAVAAITGRAEPMSGRNWAGVACGTVGVVVLVGIDVGGSDLGAVAQMAVVVVGYALGPMLLARTLSHVPPVGLTALQLAGSAVLSAPLLLLPGARHAAPTPAALVSVAVLGVVCSAAAFLMLFALVGLIGPVRSTTITYVNPAVAVVAGAVVLHERVTAWTLVGFVLVIGGSVLVGRRRSRGTAPAAPARAA